MSYKKIKSHILLLLALSMFAVLGKTQNLTGIWRGYFMQKQYDFYKRDYSYAKYKFEVQILQSKNGALKGVTYSYKETSFYGKASFTGIFMKKNKTAVLKEVKLEEVRTQDHSTACLMTCNFDYSTKNKQRFLIGEYTSVNLDSKDDCGYGTVYLEKVEKSEFRKEAFLSKTPEKQKPIPTIIPNPKLPQKSAAPTAKKPAPNPPKPKAIEPAKKPLAPKSIVDSTPILSTAKSPTAPSQPLLERKTNLIKTIYVKEGLIEINIYDNGQIDNDTITLYHNNKPILVREKLSATPLIVQLKINKNEDNYLTLVANNLGSIPPNTSLMVIKSKDKTDQVFLSSDMKNNAQILIKAIASP